MGVEHPTPVLEGTRVRFKEIAEKENLLSANVTVLARPLTPEEAIGTPGRRDFPIIIGRERILEAAFLNARGHAFTDSAREFIGTLGEVIDLPFTSNQNRAIYVATLNAVFRHLGLLSATVHCKDDDPEECGAAIARHIAEHHGNPVVGLIGLNPAIAENLVQVFGKGRVHISDLDRDQIGKQRFGVEIWDGNTRTAELVERSDVILMTGTTLQNGTFDDIWAAIQARGKHGLVYGVTAAGVCALTGIERICPCAREA
jgi:uncharacterized protein (DUF4213/DUF364 family)